MNHQQRVTLGVLRGSLPSYFPKRYKVFETCEARLASLCDAQDVALYVHEDIPMNCQDTQKAIDACRRENVDFILLIHGGFTMGDVARTLAASGLPAGAWATPEPMLEGDIRLNNFVSLNMTMSIARGVRNLQNNPMQWYFGSADSPALQARLTHTLQALKIAKCLKTGRIAVVGGLAPTFYNMEASTNELKSRLGVQVDHLDMGLLTARMEGLDASRVTQEVEAMLQSAPASGVTDEQMNLTGRAALALGDIAREGDYQALAVSDWPALQQNPGMHPGAAFSWLEETQLLPVASEGDVLGAVTQMVALAATGRVGYLLDMTEPDLDHQDLLMWHGGGGPLYLADDQGVRWINHPMIGRGTKAGPCYGAISDLVFRDGDATIFRVARDGSAFFAMEASIHGRQPSGFSGCRGWLRDFTIGAQAASLDDVVTTVMGHGLEHHFVLVPGHWAGLLGEFAAWTDQRELALIRAHNHLRPTA